MKKATAFIAAALLVGVSQAATIKWTANNIKIEGTAVNQGAVYMVMASGSGPGTTGYTAYTESSLKTAIQNGSITGAVASGKTGTAGNINIASIGNFGTGGTDNPDNISVFFVVFDKGTIADSTKYQIIGASNPQSFTFASATGEQSASFGNISTGNYSGGTWESVPEPTTVALLALGLAALGLKRKVA